MGKGNTYEAGTDTVRATRCGPVTDPSKSHKTNKRHDGKMKSLLTDATSKPYGANWALLHQTMLQKMCLQEIFVFHPANVCILLRSAIASATHPAPK